MEEKKMKLRTYILAAAAVMLSLTSCLKDQADIFEVPSSQRMLNYLENVRTVLQDSKEGWILSYYPGAAYATCYMGVKFDAQQVTAYGQEDPETPVVSSYKLTTDDGAVLSFDTYNTVLHYYATSDASHYQARGGDFEFDILDVTDSRITLRGKRSGNYCYLDKAAKPIVTFLEEANEAEDNFDIVAFTGEITGGLVNGALDPISHTLTIGRKDAEASETLAARYMIVPGGIHFNTPFTFQGIVFQDFVYDGEARTLTGSGITFSKVEPEGFVSYSKYLGKWTFSWYSGRTFPVEMVEEEAGISYKVKGLSTFFEPVFTYDAALGRLKWNAQAVGVSGSTTVMMAAWDLANSGGSLTWEEDYGMVGAVEDNTVDELVVLWSDNGETDLKIDSWILWGTDAAGNSQGSFEGWSFASGSYQLPYVESMTKIVE